jgi:hypothetical protein
MTDEASDQPWANGKGLPPHELFTRYEGCVVRVQVALQTGDLANGTAFHIGGGAYVTARHVIEDGTDLTLFTGDTRYGDKGHAVIDVLKHPDPDIDLAVITSDLGREAFGDHGADLPPKGQRLSFIPLPEIWGEWIDDSFVLTRGMICGYPRVPFSRHPNKIAVSAEVNADIDRYDKSHVHFIVSSVARGGFSGAPFVSEFDFLLGVVTEELIPDTQESPFTTVIATEPLIDIIEKNEAPLKGRLDHYLTSWSKNKKGEDIS